MTLNVILFYFISALSLFFTSTVAQNKTLKPKRRICIFVFILAFTFLAAPFLSQMATPFAIIGISFLLSYKQDNFIVNLICFYSSYLVFVLLDYTFSNLVFLFAHLTIAEAQQEHLLLFALCYTPVLFLTLKLLGWILHSKLKIASHLTSKKFSVSICLNLLTCTAIFVLGIIWGEKMGYPPKIIFFNGILFFIYFLLSTVIFLFGYKTLREEELLKVQLEHYENLTTYTQEVENLYLSMRAFKHDYLDILSSMKGYIDTQNIIELRSYFYKNILPLNEQIIDSDNRLGLLSFLEDDAIKSIISTKLMLAVQKGIHIELELKEKIIFPTIKQADLIRVLGILLNNAIEAADTSAEKEITLAFFNYKENCTIIIRNTTPPLTLPLSVLCQKQVSSKRDHSGIGLYTVQNILNDYETIYWKLDYNPPYFFVQICIPQNNRIKEISYD